MKTRVAEAWSTISVFGYPRSVVAVEFNVFRIHKNVIITRLYSGAYNTHFSLQDVKNQSVASQSNSGIRISKAPYITHL